MEFQVRTSDQVETYYHGESTYQVGDSNAVLTVTDADSGEQLTYAPGAWVKVTATETPKDYDVGDSIG